MIEPPHRIFESSEVSSRSSKIPLAAFCNWKRSTTYNRDTTPKEFAMNGKVTTDEEKTSMGRSRPDIQATTSQTRPEYPLITDDENDEDSADDGDRDIDDTTRMEDDAQSVKLEERHRFPEIDWKDFCTRYEEAMNSAKKNERALGEEARNLIEYFKVWSEASAAHDDERAAKRLRTRVHYVQHSESNLATKKERYNRIVEAFSEAFKLFSTEEL